QAAPSDFVATIDWGDGTTSPGVVTFDAASQRFRVVGSHTYNAEGTYFVSFQVSHPLTGPTPRVDAGAAVILTAGQTRQLDQTDFGVLPPGGGQVDVQTDNIAATLVQPGEVGRTPVTLFVAEFDDAPIPDRVVKEAVADQSLVASSFFDVRVTGATLGTTLT